MRLLAEVFLIASEDPGCEMSFVSRDACYRLKNAPTPPVRTQAAKSENGAREQQQQKLKGRSYRGWEAILPFRVKHAWGAFFHYGR